MVYQKQTLSITQEWDDSGLVGDSGRGVVGSVSYSTHTRGKTFRVFFRFQVECERNRRVENDSKSFGLSLLAKAGYRGIEVGDEIMKSQKIGAAKIKPKDSRKHTECSSVQFKSPGTFHSTQNKALCQNDLRTDIIGFLLLPPPHFVALFPAPTALPPQETLGCLRSCSLYLKCS